MNITEKQILLNFINWHNSEYPKNYIPNSRIGIFLMQKLESDIEIIDFNFTKPEEFKSSGNKNVRSPYDLSRAGFQEYK